MSDAAWADIERTCRDLVAGNATRLRWAWDSRFDAALATFPGADAPAILAALETSLPARWDHGSMGKAPPVVRQLAEAIGGVRSGQLILATDPSADVLVVAAWWPWGGGQTISIRVFPLAGGAAAGDQARLSATFRSWFCP